MVNKRVPEILPDFHRDLVGHFIGRMLTAKGTEKLLIRNVNEGLGEIIALMEDNRSNRVYMPCGVSIWNHDRV